MWDYEVAGWARRFFDQWWDALRWQRLEPFQKFAWMIEDHWDGIEAYCHEENKVPLGFVEGINNKIRVIQRRAVCQTPTSLAIRSRSSMRRSRQ